MAKNVIRRIVRKNGKRKVIFVDPITGAEVKDIRGYNVIDATNDYDLAALGLSPTKNNNEEPVTPTDQLDPFYKNSREQADTSQLGQVRNEANNYGYIDKPGIVGLLGMAPGMLGVVGKGINAAIGLNNVAAKDIARGVIGIDQVGPGAIAKGLLGKDEQGKVADVTIGKNQYSVGLEALDDKGKTTLTPNEARTRAGWLGVPVVEIETKGPLKGLIDNVFSKAKDEEVAQEEATQTTENVTQAPSLTSPNTPDDLPLGPDDRPSTAQQMAAVDYSGIGQNRPNAPQEGFMNALRNEVASFFGPGHTVSVVSGTEDEGKQYGAANHKTGLAVDFDVIGPTGKKADNEAMTAFGQHLGTKGFTGIGVAKGYMGADGNRMHADKSHSKGTAWGKDGTKAGMTEEAYQSIMSGMGYEASRSRGIIGKIAPLNPMPYHMTITPTPAPALTTPTSPGPESISDEITTEAGKPNQFAGKSLSPSALSQLGYGPQRSQADLDAMGRTIAGEMSGKSLRGLAEGTTEALSEFGDIVSTMENRAQSKGKESKGMSGVLGGKSYNSNLGSNSKVTNDNWSKFKDPIQQALSDFYSGKSPSKNTNSTHYYNPEIVNPGWSKSLQGKAQSGDHAFGSLKGEYTPGKGFQENLGRYSTDQINENTPAPDLGFAQKGPSFSNDYSSGIGVGGSTSYSGFGNNSGNTGARGDGSDGGPGGAPDFSGSGNSGSYSGDFSGGSGVGGSSSGSVGIGGGISDGRGETDYSGSGHGISDGRGETDYSGGSGGSGSGTSGGTGSGMSGTGSTGGGVGGDSTGNFGGGSGGSGGSGTSGGTGNSGTGTGTGGSSSGPSGGVAGDGSDGGPGGAPDYGGFGSDGAYS